MNRTWIAFTALGALVSFSSGCNFLKSRDEMNKGVASFKNAKYSESVEHFKTAVELDPKNPNARRFLATAYMTQYIPGAESPENLQNAQAAKDQFMKLLEQDPKDSFAVNSMASLNYSEAQGASGLEAKMKKLDEAKEWYEKLAQIDEKNKEAYYSLGVITWAKWYPQLATARAKLGMKPEDPGPIKDQKLKDELKAQYGPMVENGIKNLQKALDIDPQYDDAMAYINLLIRERADLADNADQYKKEIDIADNWVQKALDTKKIKAEKALKKGPNGESAP